MDGGGAAFARRMQRLAAASRVETGALEQRNGELSLRRDAALSIVRVMPHAEEEHGRVEGKTIVLDRPVPALEGKRVRVVISADEEETALSAEAAKEAWSTWAARGPQGPIDEDLETEFP